MFYLYVFFRVPYWPKIGIFLDFGFSSTFGTPPPVTELLSFPKGEIPVGVGSWEGGGSGGMFPRKTFEFCTSQIDGNAPIS